MPFLRFTRDKRGYETTSLVHADRGRQGRTRQRVLYWFRSPPNVKVGRPALDPDAIRWIEEHNPDIEFDWTQILQATAPPAPPSEDARGRRPRRTERPARTGRPERRGAQRASAAPAPAPPETKRDRESFSPEPAEKDSRSLFPPPEAQALEQIAQPDAEEAPPVALPAVEMVLGREQLIRLRARYAELQARIIEHGERGGELARVDEFRAQAESLNPDTWVTVEEARKGLQEFEPKIRDLRAALGLKRRRRSRRGGRRRRGAQTTAAAEGIQTASAGPSSNSPDQGLPAAPAGSSGGEDDEDLADDVDDGSESEA